MNRIFKLGFEEHVSDFQNLFFKIWCSDDDLFLMELIISFLPSTLEKHVKHF